MTLKTTISEALATFRAAQLDAKQERARIVARTDELSARREFLRAAPLSRADLIAETRKAITAHRNEAARSAELLRRLEWVRTTGGWLTNPSGDYALSPFHGNFHDLFSGIALLDPDALVDAMTPGIDSMDYSKAGPPIAERRVELDKIDRELASLSSQLAEIESALSAKV